MNHFEYTLDPFGKMYVHSTSFLPKKKYPRLNYYILEHFRLRYVLFWLEETISFDDSKYGGRMTRIKHIQSKYKPYDGHDVIRSGSRYIYSLRGSKSGRTQNFRVDRHDGRRYTRWCEDVSIYSICEALFSDKMVRHIREHDTPISWTTYGFPSKLTIYISRRDSISTGIGCLMCGWLTTTQIVVHLEFESFYPPHLFEFRWQTSDVGNLLTCRYLGVCVISSFPPRMEWSLPIKEYVTGVAADVWACYYLCDLLPQVVSFRLYAVYPRSRWC